eukprot:1159796-Pelagomonas_calceolata.AAC.6
MKKGVSPFKRKPFALTYVVSVPPTGASPPPAPAQVVPPPEAPSAAQVEATTPPGAPPGILPIPAGPFLQTQPPRHELLDPNHWLIGRQSALSSLLPADWLDHLSNLGFGPPLGPHYLASRYSLIRVTS